MQAESYTYSVLGLDVPVLAYRLWPLAEHTENALAAVHRFDNGAVAAWKVALFYSVDLINR